MPHIPNLRSFVDEVVSFRERFWLSGWVVVPVGRVTVEVHHAGARIDCEIAHPLPSPDVAAVHGRAGEAARFQVSGRLPAGVHADELELVFRLGPLTTRRTELYLDKIGIDPYHALEARFFAEAGPRLLEVGSRARSGNDRLARIGEREYVGMDILEGPNVDVVGDAHQLSSHFPADRFDAIFSMSTFEHILMPWKVAVEMNRVLATGGLVFVGTHQTFPLHETPWDFLRFSDTSWQAIFSPATGFAVEATALGEKAAVVPLCQHAVTRGVPGGEAFLNVGVLARKVGEPTVDWATTVRESVDTLYPQ